MAIKKLPVLGCKWNGEPQVFIDTQQGSMWQSMPTLTDGDKFIQSLFVKPFAPKHYGEKPGEIITRTPNLLKSIVRSVMRWL